jgi:hypothetical protein
MFNHFDNVQAESRPTRFHSKHSLMYGTITHYGQPSQTVPLECNELKG